MVSETHSKKRLPGFFALCSEWITDSGVLNLGGRAPGCVSVPFLFIRELALEWLIERWPSIVYNSNPPATSGGYQRVGSGVRKSKVSSLEIDAQVGN